MSQIHATAFVDPTATLGKRVNVGPFCFVGPEVVLGDGCVLHAHVSLTGPATFGKDNTFFPNCSIGAAPQDLKFKGTPTRLEVGNGNSFRENVTVHRGTEVDTLSGATTRIGNNCLLMVGVHVAHDSQLGDNVILANNVLLAGHVEVQDRVNIGGAAAIHHFVTIGRGAMVGGMSRIRHDVPPFLTVQGWDQDVRSVNIVGLQRWGASVESVAAVKKAFRKMYVRSNDRSVGRITLGIGEIRKSDLITDAHVLEIVEFLERKFAVGVSGRVREAQRKDSDRDRASFYKGKSGEKQPI